MKNLSLAYSFLGLLPLFAACAPPRWAVAPATRVGMMPILHNGVAALMRETDPRVGEAALAANLKLIEAVALTYPNEQDAKLLAAMARANYAFGFIEDDLEAVQFGAGTASAALTLRASAIANYRAGQQHAEAVLRQNDDFSAQLGAPSLDRVTLENFRAALAVLEAEDAPALFWLVFNWGGRLRLDVDPAEGTQLPKLEAMAERMLALDPDFFYGLGPHLLAGTLKGFRSPALGGTPAIAATHFAEAKRRSGGLLLPDVLLAQLVHAQTERGADFARVLTAVVNAEASTTYALLDLLAQKKACRLLAHYDDLFLEGSAAVPAACQRLPGKLFPEAQN